MKIKFILIVLLLSSYKLCAQDKTSDRIKFINHHIQDCLVTKYHPNGDSLKSFCRIGCIFVKFDVNQKALITNISYSKGSPYFITKALTNSLDSLELDRPLMQILKRLHRTVLVPFLYYYQAGCNFPPSKWTTDTATIMKNYETNLRIYASFNDTYSSIVNMLNYKNSSLNGVNCLLIAPVRVAAGSTY